MSNKLFLILYCGVCILCKSVISFQIFDSRLSLRIRSELTLHNTNIPRGNKVHNLFMTTGYKETESNQDNQWNPTNKEPTKSFSLNRSYITSMLIGQLLLYCVAIVVGTVLGIDVFHANTLSFSWDDFTTAALFSLPMVLLGALLDRLPNKYLQEIGRETKIFVLQVLGRNKDQFGTVLFGAALTSLAAAIGEEIFFRGFIFGFFQRLNFNTDISLLISSLLFGLAHFPVFGANSAVEAMLGGFFAASYIYSGYNMFVPIMVHFLYDFLSMVTIWLATMDEIKVDEDKFFRDIVIPEYSVEFYKAAKEAFDLMDLDKDGFIDKTELTMSMRLFRYEKTENLLRDVDKMFAVADKDNNGKIDFYEFTDIAKTGVYKATLFGSPLFY